MMCSGRVVCVIALAFLSATQSTRGAEIAKPADTLKGLKFLIIEVAVSDEKLLTRVGLTAEDIRAAAELRLRKHGIPIVRTVEKVAKADVMQVATVAVAVDISQSEVAAALPIAIDVSVKQLVFLARDHTLMTYSSTWRDAGYGVLRKGDAKTLTEALERSLDKLAADYLAVNDK